MESQNAKLGETKRLNQRCTEPIAQMRPCWGGCNLLETEGLRDRNAPRSRAEKTVFDPKNSSAERQEQEGIATGGSANEGVPEDVNWEINLENYADQPIGFLINFSRPQDLTGVFSGTPPP